MSYEWIGGDHGAGVCVIVVDAQPGHGPRLHKHPYEEVFVVLEGEGTFTLGDSEVTAGAGETLVAPPDTPHKFVNSGDGVLRQVDIHVSPRFVTEWLED